MKKTVTTNEILEAINEFASTVDKRFDDVNKRFDEIDKRFIKVESQMVTKDYLDDKLTDLRGDMVVLLRKEDTKVKKLVDILTKKKIISQAEANQISSMEPFPQLSL